MHILMTGGTGFLGSALTSQLLAHNAKITLLTRDPEKAKRRFGNITVLKKLDELDHQATFDAVINLAGAPILDARWSDARKEILRNSRIQSTEQLVTTISRLAIKPKVLISGSAIGYYGDQGDTFLTEKSLSKPDFPQQLCADWEAAAKIAENEGVRVCIIRTGLVLAHDGGLLDRMLLPFRLGLGGRLGDGKQWMSWIHRHDWLAIVQEMLINDAMHGVYNATAPTPVNNIEFTSTLAQLLNRPALLPVPSSLLKLALGEMSCLILGSQRVMPERLLSQGFIFQYPLLEDALKASLNPIAPN